MNIPQHVAIILDGNGRWAKTKGMPRNYGHAQGSKNVERICEEAWRLGIKYLTVYAFSTENWNRPQDEVDALKIQGVPSVFADGKLLHVGRGEFGELLAKLEEQYGIDETKANAGVKEYDVSRWKSKGIY